MSSLPTFLHGSYQNISTYRGQPQLQIQTWDILLCFWLPLSHWMEVDPACDRCGILYWKPFCLYQRQSCPTQDDVSETFLYFQIPSAKQVWLASFPRDFVCLTKTSKQLQLQKKKPAGSFYLMRLILFHVPKQTWGLSKDTTAMFQNNNYPEKHLSKSRIYLKASETMRTYFTALTKQDFFLGKKKKKRKKEWK